MHTMMRPPTWVTPAAGSMFYMVNKTFVAHSGSVTLSGDAGAGVSGVALWVRDAASVVLGVTQKVGALDIQGNGKLDLKDKDLIIDYTGASPIGSWNGSAYTGISGWIQTGRHGARGIVTTSNPSASSMTMLGYGEASATAHISGSQTSVWGGKLVDATCVLIKFTYAGDVDLNGRLDGDDFFAIDSHVLQSAAVFGHMNGDFNLDGQIDGDDYFLIDSNYVTQDVVL
jgi:hypothetical protein